MTPAPRTTWRDPEDYAVHAVTVPVEAWAEHMRPLIAAVIATEVVGLSAPGLHTACGEPLSSLVTLNPHEEVTCEQCLAAEGRDALAAAEALLVEARLPEEVPA